MAGVKKALEIVREDDFVEYYLFPAIGICNENEEETLLKSFLNKANKVVEKYADDYLWHKDEFKLTTRTSACNSLIHAEGEKEHLPPHLYGVSHFGDNIEDEWFIVFILTQITEEIGGSIARVHDADGEFILIEAADYLPDWASPEICQNRVYLLDGNVHLIPYDDTPNPKTDITITEAINQIRKNPGRTLAPQNVQKQIETKLKDYPAKTKDSVHRATIYVPIGVAYALKTRPKLISGACRAFLERDTLDSKVCRAMKFFPPENRVRITAKFTRCLYAMLKNSKFVPDRVTGWNLPRSGSKDYKSHSLGAKVACGFEILASQAGSSGDLESDKKWMGYLESLKEKGYFRGLLEHSIGYNNLLNKAKEFYSSQNENAKLRPSLGKEILDLVKGFDFEGFEADAGEEDDDSWLEIDKDRLEKFLEEKYGQEEVLRVNESTNVEEFGDKLGNFLNKSSDYEGVELEKKKSKVTFSDDEKKEGNCNNRVNFDPNSFACAVQNILNFVIPEDDSWDLDDESDMSEYEEDNCVKSEVRLEKNEMDKYMNEMDKELAKTTIGESFEKKNGDRNAGFDDIEEFKPVDIDVNALKNILESYRSQMGEAGPSSNMLGPIGMSLDAERDGK